MKYPRHIWEQIRGIKIEELQRFASIITQARPSQRRRIGQKGTDLFIDDRQAVFSRISLTADDPATAPLALPTVKQNKRRSYAAWIQETISSGEWEPIRPSLQWGQWTNSPS